MAELEPCQDCLAARVAALEEQAERRALLGWLLLAALLALVYAWHAGWIRLVIRLKEA